MVKKKKRLCLDITKFGSCRNKTWSEMVCYINSQGRCSRSCDRERSWWTYFWSVSLLLQSQHTHTMQQWTKLLNLFLFACCVIGHRSGKELDITSQRIAASNASLKELFVEALRLTNVWSCSILCLWSHLMNSFKNHTWLVWQIKAFHFITMSKTYWVPFELIFPLYDHSKTPYIYKVLGFNYQDNL